ncbi:hypothetical protein Y5S_03264 [Alcanivorax nanhaiticus]|uniref:Polysaccharide biosynthesis protein n=1 Tax=Alcanivorax nanhaiticus TaxID=1177154 RepID=A0A095ULQ6_9GAMM|nr:hypothetical protein [Alcanivorax nanhaiticus]KGD63455.1 hypothetical protein Y5S_03264 [Alcanivorax nanhaiticus]
MKKLWYVPILAIAMLVMMLRPLLYARLLSHEEFAIYSAALLVSSTFSILGCLGLQTMLQRQMPMDLLAGRFRSSLVLLLQSLMVSIVCFLVGSLLPVLGGEAAGLASAGLLAGLLHGLSQQTFLLATIESRSRGESIRFSNQNLYRACIVLGAGYIASTYRYSSTDVILAEALVSIGLSVLHLSATFRRGKYSFSILLAVALARFSKIDWASAISLAAVIVIGFIFANGDRWVAAEVLSPEYFAGYAFVWIVIAASQSMQVIVNASFFPSLARAYAEFGIEKVFMRVVKASCFILAAGLLFSIPATMLLAWLINEFYPGYVFAASILPLFIVIAVFRFSDFWSSMLIVVGKESPLLAITVASGLVGLSLWWGGLQLMGHEPLSFESMAFMALTVTVVRYLAVVGYALKVRLGEC